MNEQLKTRLRGIQDVLMAPHRATTLLPNATKGDEREVLVREFLEKVFPAPYRFGGGATLAVGVANGAARNRGARTYLPTATARSCHLCVLPTPTVTA